MSQFPNSEFRTESPQAQPVTPHQPRVLSFVDERATIGQVKCERCGSTDIAHEISRGGLTCRSCRNTWTPVLIEQQADLTNDISQLVGVVTSEHAANLSTTEDEVLTLQCSSCHAEVTINTSEQTTARCHWCRNTLSASARVNNGTVPDGLVPFAVPKEQAEQAIASFVKERTRFANPEFVSQFSPSEVVGVYLPYFCYDGNVTATVEGEGEIETRRWTEEDDEGHSTTYHDADVYRIMRHFDMYIDDMYIESSADKGRIDNRSNTNNIIQSLLPFDAKQAVAFHPNYLRGFTSERRDVDCCQIEPALQDRLLSTARAQAGQMVERYDRGVRWTGEQVTSRGARWVSLALPVWLYSYQEPETGIKHYIAVNGQSGSVMGSVPLNRGRLTMVTAAATLVTFVVMMAAVISLL